MLLGRRTQTRFVFGNLIRPGTDRRMQGDALVMYSVSGQVALQPISSGLSTWRQNAPRGSQRRTGAVSDDVRRTPIGLYDDLCAGYNYDLISITRPFDASRLLIKGR